MIPELSWIRTRLPPSLASLDLKGNEITGVSTDFAYSTYMKGLCFMFLLPQVQNLLTLAALPCLESVFISGNPISQFLRVKGVLMGPFLLFLLPRLKVWIILVKLIHMFLLSVGHVVMTCALGRQACDGAVVGALEQAAAHLIGDRCGADSSLMRAGCV